MGEERDFSKLPECDLLINYTIERLRKGLYTFILVTGLPGSGKSSFCQRFAELLLKKIKEDLDNKKYYVNDLQVKDVMDNLLELIRFTKSATKPAKIGIIEELSVLFGSRRAMAQENVAVGRIFDTCRKKQVILIANAPIFTSIDSHLRSMAHILIETVSINKTQEVVIAKAWRLQTNPGTGKTYRHTFRRKGKDTKLFFTHKPNSEVWEEYENKKDKFLDDLYERLEKTHLKKEEKIAKALGIKVKRKTVKTLTNLELKRWDLRQQGLTYDKIAEMEGVSPQSIQQMIKKIEKKTLLLGKSSKNQTLDK